MKNRKQKRYIQLLRICSIIIFAVILLIKSFQSYFQTHLDGFEKERLHIKNSYSYKILNYVDTDIFGSFRIIQLHNSDDIQSLKHDFASDDNITSYNQMNDHNSNSMFEHATNKYPLPFAIDCGCYTLYSINAGMKDGGYFYQIIIHENTLYVYYTSR